jgi:putative transcriptional regulator
MKQKKPTAGERIMASARHALAFARSELDHGGIVHIPAEINVKAIWEQMEMSQSELAHAFGFSTRTLEHGEHRRRVPIGSARAFLTVISREPVAVRRALMDYAAS